MAVFLDASIRKLLSARARSRAGGPSAPSSPLSPFAELNAQRSHAVVLMVGEVEQQLSVSTSEAEGPVCLVGLR